VVWSAEAGVHQVEYRLDGSGAPPAEPQRS
jgi:hypothetical protein